MKNLFFFLIAILTFSACELTVDAELPDYEKQMVVHCYPNTESFSTAVSTTVGLLENGNPEPLADATVELYEGSQLLFSVDGNAIVPFTEPLKNGQEYTLKVTHPEFETMQATQKMPQHVPVKKAVYKENGGIDEFGDEVDVLQISIDDPAEEENYYEIVLLVYQDPINNPDQVYFVYPAENNSQGISTVYSDVLVVSDQLFNGQSYTLSPKFYGYYSNEEVEFKLVWRNITKERFLYLKSVTGHIYAQDDPFAEPVGLLTNFDQGLGIFALYNEETYPVEK